MTTEHLRPLLDDMRSLHLFFRVSERLARAQIPEGVADLLRLGRITALSKPDGGVRGIVAGDVVRRLVARTIAKQLSTAVEQATSPHQYALTTRAGCECVAHVLQGLTEVDPLATVTSIDGISAFDLISRGTMLEGLRQVRGRSAVVPFARLFYGRPSEYLWEDASGEVHKIPQGEGGEQGDAMMPLQAVNPTARVWRGSMLPEVQQGMKVLGTPLGHPAYVAEHLRSVSREQQVLLDRIPLVQDLQTAWLLLLHCASARVNYLMRAVSPDSTAEFAQSHDEALWQCLCLILRIDPTEPLEVRDAAAVPLSLGGLGVRSACRMRVPAYWASWADCLGMIHQRHRDVADQLVRELDGDPQTPCLQAAASIIKTHWSHGVRATFVGCLGHFTPSRAS